jgi:hypothetical protein
MSKIATVVDPLVKIKKKAKIDGRESKGRWPIEIWDASILFECKHSSTPGAG